MLGGGYAGMAAAVTLAQQGVPVTVYEAAAELGGRARRVPYNGTLLDNGLHILIGACREVLRLVSLVNPSGEQALLRLPLDWHIHRFFRLRLPALPAPLHLGLGLLTARGARIGARLAAAKFVHAMRKQAFSIPHDMSVAQLLALHGQDEAMVRFLWRPLCLSALNTPPEIASARIFLNVLRDSLNAARSSSDVMVSRHDLTALFPEPAAEYVRERGGKILLRHPVEQVSLDRDGFHVQTGRQRASFTHVVAALPPYRVLSVIKGLPDMQEAAAKLAGLHYLPIHSVYLQYPQPVRLPAPMIGLSGGLAHWAFDRDAICGQKGLLAVVISGPGPHEDFPQKELAQTIHAELAEHFGPLPAPLWQRVIAEKRATFACVARMERPSSRTALPRFYLAGDYVQGDYPATLEGAVRSGVYCAQSVLESASPV